MAARTSGRFLTGAGVLASGQLASQAAVFLRNIVIVRTLTQVEYGIAATFGITVAIITSATNLSPGGLLVQDKKAEPKLQRAVQLVVFFQGLFQALVVFLLAPYMASWFNTVEYEWVYRWLAIIPLANGLLHLDPVRFGRAMEYKARILSTTLPEVVSLVVVCAFAPFIQDYRLVVISLTTIPVTALLVTHLSAERSYGWRSDRESVRRILSFGWPLLLNGLLMLIVSQGDRFLIGSAESLSVISTAWLGEAADQIHFYDKIDLALYAIAASLAFMPQIFAARTAAPLFLPSLSSLQDDPQGYARQFRSCFRFLSVAGTAMAVGFLLSGTTVTVLVYSEQYAGVGPFIGWLGIATGVRILRMAPVIAAFSQADTKIPLLANLGRSSAIVGYLFVTLQGMPLVWISRCLAIGEVVAVLIAMIALRQRHRIWLHFGGPPILFMMIWVLIASQIAASGILVGPLQTLGATLLIELALLASAVATLLPVSTLKEVARTRGHE
ncbi:MAG: oligosaccharide flippase family protein [bacterium]|nr:oligosaccharide flippase family protein [bacterium]